MSPPTAHRFNLLVHDQLSHVPVWLRARTVPPRIDVMRNVFVFRPHPGDFFAEPSAFCNPVPLNLLELVAYGLGDCKVAKADSSVHHVSLRR